MPERVPTTPTSALSALHTSASQVTTHHTPGSRPHTELSLEDPADENLVFFQEEVQGLLKPRKPNKCATAEACAADLRLDRS